MKKQSNFIKATILLILAIAMCMPSISASAAAEQPLFEGEMLFVNGTEGYANYRIPAMVEAANGDILAFCEGRVNGPHDDGNIDIVMKRSTDGGDTWSNLQIVVDNGSETAGNMVPIVDEYGTIWMVFCKNNDTIWVTKNDDNGNLPWSTPVNITSTTKPADAGSWVATGPGHGLQLESGRLLVPSYAKPNGDYRVYSIFSDDNGDTWEMGEYGRNDTHEASVVETMDGNVIASCRNYDDTNRRCIQVSSDECDTFDSYYIDYDLYDPRCEGCLIRYTDYITGDKNRILYSAPGAGGRYNMTVYLSYDECETWSVVKLIDSGPSAYSEMVILPDKSIGMMYELGNLGGIKYVHFNLEWLTDGEDYIGNNNIIDESWDNLNSWSTEGYGDVEISPTAQLHLQDDTNTPAKIYRTDVSIPSAYIVEYEAKLDDFAPGSPGDTNDCSTLGIKICDGSYRLMLSIEDDGIWAITSAGSWYRVKTLTMDNDWHIYKAVVNNGTADIYMDGIWQCSFYMQVRSDSDQFEHWCEGISTNAAEAHLEYSRIYAPILEEEWTSIGSWSTGGSGTAEISPAGQLHLSDSVSGVTTISRTGINIPASYVYEYRAKLDDFAPGSPGDEDDCNTMATAIYDGTYRLMLSLEDDGIWAIDNPGSWKRVKTVNIGTGWNTYKVVVNNGYAEVYMNGIWQCSFYLQPRSDSDQIEHFVNGTSANGAESHVDYTRIYNPVIDQTYDNIEDWDTGGNGIVELSPTAKLHLKDNTATPAKVYTPDNDIPSEYVVEYEAKLEDFAPGSPGDANDCSTLGTKICDGSYRLMVSIEDDGIWAITSAGSWSRVKTLTMDNDWHTYRVAVNNGTANVYMDDNWQCSFSMQERTDLEKFEHWCEGISTNVAESYVEYSKLYYPN